MSENRNWLQKVFGNLFQRRTGLSQVKVMSGYTPIFTPWGNKPYEADIVRAAVDAIARNGAKLKAKHIRRVNGDIITPTDRHIERLLQVRPNPHMSAYDMQYKLITTLLMDNNAFAYPEWRAARLEAVWPVNCVASEFLEDELGTIYVKFYFADRGAVVLPYSEVIHLRRHYYDNDLIGSPNQPINATLSAIHTTNEGLAQAVKTSANLRGILKYTGMLKESDIQANRDRFVKEYLTVQNTGGVAALDAKADYVELKSQPIIVNAAQMKELRDAVFRYFGVSEKIILGNYNEDEWNAFYESTIEPIAVQMSLEYTTKLFSDREIGHGNEIVFEANRLQYASVQTKLQLVQLVDRGIMVPNALAEVFNLPPVEGGDKPIRRLDTRPVDDGGTPIAEGAEGELKPQVVDDVDKLADTSLNGAQIDGLLKIVMAVANGEIPRDTGVEALIVSFQFTKEQAEKIMANVGKGFEPELDTDNDEEGGDDDVDEDRDEGDPPSGDPSA